MHSSSPNHNDSFRSAFANDPKIFARRTGVFTYMYEAAARFGNLTMPFPSKTERAENPEKPAFKI